MWVDQRVESIDDLLPLKLYSTDLDDFIGIGIQAGGFEVEGDICLVHDEIITLWERGLIETREGIAFSGGGLKRRVTLIITWEGALASPSRDFVAIRNIVVDDFYRFGYAVFSTNTLTDRCSPTLHTLVIDSGVDRFRQHLD